MDDSRLPVIVGVGQIRHECDIDSPLEPVDLMTEAVRLAGNDAAGVGLLSAIDQIIAVTGIWSYPDPGRMVADRVGSPDAATAITEVGGNTPQASMAMLGEQIVNGELDVGVVVGGESIYTRRQLGKVDRELVTSGTELDPAVKVGSALDMTDPAAEAVGLDMPVNIYPLFESAIQLASGRSPAEHLAHVGQLWEGYNKVAVANPFSWSHRSLTADEIVTPSSDNRMVVEPYTMAMVSNWFVDQAAAVIVCSVAAARRMGISADKWVYLHSNAEATAPAKISERDRWDRSPAIYESGTAALSLAGVGVDDVATLDLYSCFPSVVQLTMSELGIGMDRQLTQTGGLTFFGGPMNNYVTHSIASVVDGVREAGGYGLVHANGGYATKQAFGIYGSTPPAGGFRSTNVQDQVDRYPRRICIADHDGPSELEARIVLHEKTGPIAAVESRRTPAGARFFTREDAETHH